MMHIQHSVEIWLVVQHSVKSTASWLVDIGGIFEHLHALFYAVDTKKSVQFNEEVQVEQFDPNEVTIDEKVIDQALDEIQNADPTGLTEDSTEMLNLESKWSECYHHQSEYGLLMSIPQCIILEIPDTLSQW